jgi:hypothetical protein
MHLWGPYYNDIVALTPIDYYTYCQVHSISIPQSDEPVCEIVTAESLASLDRYILEIDIINARVLKILCKLALAVAFSAFPRFEWYVRRRANHLDLCADGIKPGKDVA